MEKENIIKKVIAKVKPKKEEGTDFIDEYTCLCDYWTPKSKYVLETGEEKELPPLEVQKGEDSLKHVRSPYGYNIFHIGDREVYVYDKNKSLNNISGKIGYEILGYGTPTQRPFYNKGMVDGYGGRIMLYLANAKKD